MKIYARTYPVKVHYKEFPEFTGSGVGECVVIWYQWTCTPKPQYLYTEYLNFPRTGKKNNAQTSFCNEHSHRDILCFENQSFNENILHVIFSFTNYTSNRISRYDDDDDRDNALQLE